jgi:hypothetical protein
MTTPVTVQYRKHPDTVHWRQAMRRLGRDEHGVWLGMDAGDPFQKGEQPPVPSPTPMVQLIAPDAWWTLLYNGPQHRYPVYVDVIRPARWIGEARVEMVDLDLDVVRLPDGRVEVLDEDEFADHQVRLAYPPDWIAAARRTADEVAARLRAGAEPFATVMQTWHDQLTRP